MPNGFILADDKRSEAAMEEMRDTTEYFKYTRKRPDRKHLRMDWIEYVIQNPVKEVDE